MSRPWFFAGHGAAARWVHWMTSARQRFLAWAEHSRERYGGGSRSLL